MGPTAEVLPEVRSLSVQAGDLMMLCSDGLHGAVPHCEIEQLLAATTADTLEDSCAQLIALAKQYHRSEDELLGLSPPPSTDLPAVGGPASFEQRGKACRARQPGALQQTWRDM